jgi:pimeloyl-ACP methyl ester carboxylesterase
MTLHRTTTRTIVVSLGICVATYPLIRLKAASFIRSDVDANGTVEMTDAVHIFGFLFLGTPRILSCNDAADANDSGEVDMSDGVYILVHLFNGGREPPAPFPGCDNDTTDDALDCRLHSFCPVPFCESIAFKIGDIDVGGHTLRFQSRGVGCPGIVLDSGLGDSGIASFDGILAQVAAIGRLLVYDRAGLGASQPGLEPRTSRQIVAELHTLLEKAQFEPPYVLVGHSMSGYDQRVFANMYPGEVAGMVFVDGSHEYFFNQWAELYPAEWETGNQVLENFYVTQPPGVRAEWESFKTFRLEAPGPIPDVPIVVLTSLKVYNDFAPEVEQALTQIWDEAHEMLARSVTNGSHISLPGVGHYIHQEQPQVVIDAIRQIVEGVR